MDEEDVGDGSKAHNSMVNVHFKYSTSLVVRRRNQMVTIAAIDEMIFKFGKSVTTLALYTYNEMEMSNMLAVWPVYSRTRVPLLESIKRITPSKPAEKRRCGCLGCHTSFTTPAD